MLCEDCRFTYGNTPWGLLSTFGGSSSMRGYFEGRFRDKSVITACAELRQHVLGRSGVAIWGGAGTVFALARLRATVPLRNAL